MNPINIHQFPEAADPAALLRYKIAVMQAYAAGQPVESRLTLLGSQTKGTGLFRMSTDSFTWAPATESNLSFNWSFYDYRIMAPKAVVTPSRFFCHRDNVLFGVPRPGQGTDAEQYCVEVRPDGTACYLHLDGHREETSFWTLDKIYRKMENGLWLEFDGNMEAFRPKPKIAEGHNPRGLTVDQVGTGYRLLTAEEIKVPKQRGVQFWSVGDDRWLYSSMLTSEHCQLDTYRTSARPGEYRPKKIAVGHNPAKLTVDQIGAGYRTLSLEEAAHRQDASKRDNTSMPEGIEIYTGEWKSAPWSGDSPTHTYRTQKPVGFYLPNISRRSDNVAARGHNPENLTAQQLEAEKGWRLLSSEEHAFLASLNANAATRSQLPLVGSDLEYRMDFHQWETAQGGRQLNSYRTKKPAGWYTASAVAARAADSLQRSPELSWYNNPAVSGRVPPFPVAAGHNPNLLTEEQVGVSEGWRLLTLDEIKHRASQGEKLKATFNIQNGDLPNMPFRWYTTWPVVGNDVACIYRTKLPPGHFLPRPKPTTVKDWLETLPPGYRERALRNLSNECASASISSLELAIGGAFRWSRSPEGLDFWSKVGLWAQNPKTNKLPALPRT